MRSSTIESVEWDHWFRLQQLFEIELILISKIVRNRVDFDIKNCSKSSLILMSKFSQKRVCRNLETLKYWISISFDYFNIISTSFLLIISLWVRHHLVPRILGVIAVTMVTTLCSISMKVPLTVKAPEIYDSIIELEFHRMNFVKNPLVR